VAARHKIFCSAYISALILPVSGEEEEERMKRGMMKKVERLIKKERRTRVNNP
jgi:hypothetical protein